MISRRRLYDGAGGEWTLATDEFGHNVIVAPGGGATSLDPPYQEDIGFYGTPELFDTPY